MLFFSLFVANALFVAAKLSTYKEYNCDLESKSCDQPTGDYDEKKLLYYDVNPMEGFNLRRDVYMRFAIMMADAQKAGKTDWELVLPPWYNLYHWKVDQLKQQPWSNYFDIEALKSFAPVVEMYETFKNTSKKILEIDTLYILKNFEDAFENGIFEEKWRVIGECDYNGYWGYENITAKEILCVKFQGKVSKLWELISLHPNDKKVMFAHSEIPLHDNYGTKTYWDCRKSMKFNKDLVKIAQNYISGHLDCDDDKCNSYISIHWRRWDFALSRGKQVPTLIGTANQIHNLLSDKYPHIDKVFIATDTSINEVMGLETQLNNLGYVIYFFLPDNALVKQFGDGGAAIIDQIICSHSAYFIGTHESTFTYRIQEEREIIGFDTNTTFNRLCPDEGECEEPSIWTIVH